LAAVNVAQAKRRQAAADLLVAESAFYDPNKKRLTDAKIKRIDAAFSAAQATDDKRAQDLGDALAVSEKANVVYANEKARLGIRDETPAPEPEEVFADSTPAKKVKTPKKSLDSAFIVVEATRTPTKSEKKKAAKAIAKDELKAARIDAAAAKAAAKAAAEDARVEAKAAPPLPKGFETLQKLAKKQTAARKEAEKGRAKYYEMAGLAVPEAAGADPLTGRGRFLGRFA
jgi:hypothetical protein